MYTQAFNQNRISSLMHRWWSFYESTERNIENQLDLFDSTFEIESIAGNTTEKTYIDRLSMHPLTDQNSHQLVNLEITKIENGQIFAKAQIKYQRLRDKELAGYYINYDIVALETQKTLPKLKKLKLDLDRPYLGESFQNMYHHNRILSLVEYFGAIFDLNDGDPTPFNEILDETFTFDAVSQVFDSKNKFMEYFKHIPNHVEKSTHIISHFTYHDIGHSQFTVKFNYTWNAILKDGKKQKGVSEHNWIVEDKKANGTSKRYPNLIRANVKWIKPPTSV